MNDIHILMGMVTGLGAIVLVLWKQVNGRLYTMDARFDRMDARFDRMDVRFDKMDEKLTDIDRRLCRLEGAFSSKECCMLHHHETRKAE